MHGPRKELWIIATVFCVFLIASTLLLKSTTMDPAEARRNQLIQLAGQIQNGIDLGQPVDAFVREYELLVPESDIENLCHSDWSLETIVDVSLGQVDAKRKLNEDELRQLITQIMVGPAETEAADMLRVQLFNHNCRHPAGSDLIFFPEDALGTREPTVEQVFQAAVHGEQPDAE